MDGEVSVTSRRAVDTDLEDLPSFDLRRKAKKNLIRNRAHSSWPTGNIHCDRRAQK